MKNLNNTSLLENIAENNLGVLVYVVTLAFK